MKHASLFSGIGGAELAAEWMGWDNIFHCEINPFGRRVLDYWFPKSKSYEDITKTDFSPWRGKIDILTGGFPCQPFSQAGKRKGDTDDRYLWPQMLRAIREIRPTWVVGENVAGITSMVESCEDIKVGRTDDIFEENYIYRKDQQFTIERICKDFEREGYSIQPIVIPACAVGAPHRRDRVWFIAHCDNARVESKQERSESPDGFEPIAHPDSVGGDRRGTESNGKNKDKKIRADIHGKIKGFGNERATTDTESEGLERERGSKLQKTNDRFANICGKYGENKWSTFPTKSPICCGNDGISDRLDGITFPKWRAESIKAYGNAWVPQVAYEIFKAIGSIYNK